MAAGAREFALGGGLPAQRFALGRIGSNAPTGLLRNAADAESRGRNSAAISLTAPLPGDTINRPI
jgi:hypothetical protein